MSFFALILALMLEQARPLSPGNGVYGALATWVRWVAQHTDSGQRWQAWLAWGLGVGLPSLVVAGVYGLLNHWSLVASFVWLVLVLYFTLGFRQFSHHFTQVRDALHTGQIEAAHQVFRRWLEQGGYGIESTHAHGQGASDVPLSQWLKPFLAHSVLSAHRHVFGVLAAFLVLWYLGLGPAGAVLYRLAEYASRQWVPGRSRAGDPGPSPALQNVARRAWGGVDWLPARATATAFAVVGNFEEAVAGWRNEASSHGLDGDGVVLAAAAGALNVCLVSPRELRADDPAQASSLSRPEPTAAHLNSTVGLVWRSVVLAMLLLALLGLARLPL